MLLNNLNITHLMNEAARADRVIVINDGKVIGEGTPKEIFANTELVRQAGLELPQCAALLGELRARGIEIDGTGITPEECADILINKLQIREEK